MSILKQVKDSATQFVETLEEGWDRLVARSGRALTRFTRRKEAGEDGSDLPDVAESWGFLAGEVAETDTHVVVRLEVPGMNKDDFEISVDNGMLHVRGEKRFERDRRNASYHVFEAAYGSFERMLALPREVDTGRAEADYRQGILTVRLPKAAPRSGRAIKVS